MMPQWDFLNFLAGAAAEEPTFTLLMSHTATWLVRNGGRVPASATAPRTAPRAHSWRTWWWPRTAAIRCCARRPA